jgi:DNA-binding MarR family transcriptional regulator
MMKYTLSTANRIIEAMGIIVNKTRKFADSALRASDLTFTQFGTLFAVYQRIGSTMSQRELAVSLETDTTTIMVVCDALEKKGFIKRAADPDDRRVNRIEISEPGKRAIEAGLPKILEAFSPAESAITAQEAEAILPIMQKMLDAVRKSDVKKPSRGN